MNILVTGGAGFIGSNFVRKALQSNWQHKLVVFDKLTYAGRMENLRGLEVDFVKADICDEAAVEKAFKDFSIDAIIHFAAETHVDNSIQGDDAFIHSNVLGVHVLLKLALMHNVKRFLHISTDEVYGSIEKGSFKESNKLSPRNPYSASKAAAEMLVNAYVQTHGLNAIITRTCNNYGPFQHEEKFIPHCILLCLQGKPVSVYGKGLNVRDWIFVEDNCDALMFLFEHGAKGEIYNISAGQELENSSVAKAILEAFGKSEKDIVFVEDRKGHDFRYSISSSKLVKLGWKAKTSFGQGLGKTIEWYKQNKWVFEK